MSTGKYMSVEEIHASFESEWVVLKDPVTTESLEVMGGILVAHSTDRTEVYSKANELLIPRHTAFMYTGKIPEGTVVMLTPFLWGE